MKQIFAESNPIKKHQMLTEFVEEFGQAAIQKGLGKATHAFSMFGEGIIFLELAKKKGLNTITEIYISPSTYDIVQQERESFPDLETKLPDAIIEQDYNCLSRLCKVTDTYIVPSQFVQAGLKEFGVDLDRCHIVPYAVGESWFRINNQPTQGRILFVGTAEIRKGIHILGMAAQKLAHRNYEFRVAGGVSDAIRNHPLTKKLTFLDRVPRANIQQEYAQADIFVLPSLAEGSAEVTYEALAVGLPIITTEAAGSVVRDGIEGFIIPERDADALADSIETLIENRELRNCIAAAAKERAKDYTWEKYTKRLLAVFNNL
ncbi:MAG: glycosyltransferase family 4 protein [Moorea sp. SIO3G5]|nr:glycosyltransferase family 4 protein [Moorena sp. SIO3G5]